MTNVWSAAWCLTGMSSTPFRPQLKRGMVGRMTVLTHMLKSGANLIGQRICALCKVLYRTPCTAWVGRWGEHNQFVGGAEASC